MNWFLFTALLVIISVSANSLHARVSEDLEHATPPPSPGDEVHITCEGEGCKLKAGCQKGDCGVKGDCEQGSDCDMSASAPAHHQEVSHPSHSSPLLLKMHSHHDEEEAHHGTMVVHQHMGDSLEDLVMQKDRIIRELDAENDELADENQELAEENHMLKRQVAYEKYQKLMIILHAIVQKSNTDKAKHDLATYEGKKQFYMHPKPALPLKPHPRIEEIHDAGPRIEEIHDDGPKAVQKEKTTPKGSEFGVVHVEQVPPAEDPMLKSLHELMDQVKADHNDQHKAVQLLKTYEQIRDSHPDIQEPEVYALVYHSLFDKVLANNQDHDAVIALLDRFHEIQKPDNHFARTYKHEVLELTKPLQTQSDVAEKLHVVEETEEDTTEVEPVQQVAPRPADLKGGVQAETGAAKKDAVTTPLDEGPPSVEEHIGDSEARKDAELPGVDSSQVTKLTPDGDEAETLEELTPAERDEVIPAVGQDAVTKVSTGTDEEIQQIEQEGILSEETQQEREAKLHQQDLDATHDDEAQARAAAKTKEEEEARKELEQEQRPLAIEDRKDPLVGEELETDADSLPGGKEEVTSDEGGKGAAIQKAITIAHEREARQARVTPDSADISALETNANEQIVWSPEIEHTTSLLVQPKDS